MKKKYKWSRRADTKAKLLDRRRIGRQLIQHLDVVRDTRTVANMLGLTCHGVRHIEERALHKIWMSLRFTLNNQRNIMST